MVGTTYFYWYDIDSQSHIIDPDGTDALTTHPADMHSISYKRVSWHKQQLTDMIDAGGCDMRVSGRRNVSRRAPGPTTLVTAKVSPGASLEIISR